MYIKILLNYILGYVNILVEGFFTERFINTCINKNIFLFNIIKMRKRTGAGNLPHLFSFVFYVLYS